MASHSIDNGTLAGPPAEDSSHDQGAQSGSWSDTDVEPENGEEEQRKDFIQKRLTLTFKDVTVHVKASDTALGETFWSRIDPRQLAGLFKGNKHPKRVSNSILG